MSIYDFQIIIVRTFFKILFASEARVYFLLAHNVKNVAEMACFMPFAMQNLSLVNYSYVMPGVRNA